MPLAEIVALLTSKPAAVFSLGSKGRVAKGLPADITLFDAKRTWAFDAAKSLSKSRNTPFHDFAMQGRVHTTIINGHIVFQQH